MKEYLIVKVGYAQVQKQELEVPTTSPVLILEGCINQQHDFDMSSKQVKVKLSDGSLLIFYYNREMNNWHLDHNKRMSDAPKLYSVIRNQERDGSDEILIKYAVSNATIYTPEDGLKMYGEPQLTKDEFKAYETLVDYLAARGFICVDEIKRDLRLIITGNYNSK